MRVLHVQKSTGIGGSERYLLGLLPDLVARGTEVRMVVLGAGSVERFVAPLQAAGIQVVVIPAGPDVNPAMSFRILREIRRFRPDIVHTHLIHADLYGQVAARWARVPGVITFHGSHPFYRRQPYLGVARAAGRMAVRTIAVSHHVARFLTQTRITDTARIHVVYIGVQHSDRAVDEETRATARRQFALSVDEIAIGVASRLVPFKGHGFLIEAFAHSLASDVKMRLLVAGDGESKPDLEALARTTAGPAVRFLGFVDDVPTFMSACDVIVLPTLEGFGEGLSVATLEAMAAGRPVVATSVDSLPEIVVPDETGLLVTPGDVTELAAALSKLSHDKALRERLGEAGLARARAVFRVDKMLDQTVAIYDEIVDQHKARTDVTG